MSHGPTNRPSLPHVLEQHGVQGNGKKFVCPFHPDQDPSLSVFPGDGGNNELFKCHGCGKTGDVFKLISLLEGRPIGDVLKEHGAPEPARTPRNTPPCTLKTLARQKQLPSSFLQGVGMVDRTTGTRQLVEIPYRDANGTQVATRLRQALQKGDRGDERFRWAPGSILYLYGLDRFEPAVELGYTVIVEGESDCWTLWHAGIPAVGVPGANTWKDAWEDHLAGIPRIYVVREPDAGGQNLIQRLLQSSLRDSLYVIDLDGDVSDLWIKVGGDLGAFKAAWERAIDNATPIGEAVRDAPLEDPLPIQGARTVTPFPIDDAFPPGLKPVRDYIVALAEAHQVPVDLPAMLLLPIVAITISQKAEVRLRPDWLEPACVWTLVLLASGNRKSAILRQLLEVIYTWERDEAERLKAQIAEEEEERQLNERRLKQLRTRSTEDDTDADQARQEAIELAKELAEEEPTAAPQLVTTESTTEALAGLLVDNHERILIASSEADPLDVMLGRYSRGQPNFGILLAGQSGDSFRVQRRGRKPDHLERPALSIALTVQPDAVEGLFSSRQAKARGVLARFLACAPQSPLGSRKTDPEAVPAHLVRAYDDALRRLLDRPLNTEIGPLVIPLSAKAAALFHQFREKIEPELGPTGQLNDRTDWAGKLCGNVGRIALILHCLEVWGLRANSANCRDEICTETMTAALAWVPYLIDQEALVAGVVGTDPVALGAERISRWLYRTRKETFSRREAFENCKNVHRRKVSDMDPCLELLQELHHIYPLPPAERPGAGRSPSPRFLVNPRRNQGRNQ